MEVRGAERWGTEDRGRARRPRPVVECDARKCQWAVGRRGGRQISDVRSSPRALQMHSARPGSGEAQKPCKKMYPCET